MRLSDIFTKFKDKVLKPFGSIISNPAVWVWIVPILMIMPNIGLTITESNSFLAKITNLILPFGIYLLLCTFSRRIGRAILWMIPLMVFAAFQIVLLFLYGESIIAIDMFLNVMTTNFTEATELLANLKSAIATVLIIYIPPIAAGIYFVCRHVLLDEVKELLFRRIALWICAAGIVLLLLTCVFEPEFKPRRELFPYNVCENLVSAIVRTYTSSHYDDTSAGFSYKPQATHNDTVPEIYVIVIGETSRAANWQLNGYGRQTNPLLSQEPNLVSFGKALSEINTTHKSVPMLMSYLTADNFGEEVAKTKSIFSAFNELGYETSFISNQRRNHSYIDFYGSEAKKVNFLTDANGPQADSSLLQPFRVAISDKNRNKIFIILHTYGSHFEYNKRYPADMAYFKPDNNSSADPSNREQLVNAYDNTIRYTDMTLASIIDILRDSGRVAALIYTSDHGEDIFDDERERFLHASPVATYYQLHVPMIVWTSDRYNELYPEKTFSLRNNSNKDVSSSASVFHTVLDLAGITSPYYNKSLSLSSPDYHSPKRRYLNDYNESVDFNHAGFHNEDFSILNKLNISTS